MGVIYTICIQPENGFYSRNISQMINYKVVYELDLYLFCLLIYLKRVIEGNIKGGVEVTGRRGRRRRRLLDNLKERRGYSHLNEEALDRTVWRAGVGRGFGPVVRQTTEWMNGWIFIKHSGDALPKRLRVMDVFWWSTLQIFWLAFNIQACRHADGWMCLLHVTQCRMTPYLLVHITSYTWGECRYALDEGLEMERG